MLVDNVSFVDSGAAYLFRRLDRCWVHDSKITSSDKAANDNFGSCGVLARDGSRAIIGAHLEDPGGTTNAGAVYVYS